MNAFSYKLNTLGHQLTSLVSGLFLLTLLAFFVFNSHHAQAATSLADKPLFSTNGVPGNVALALSVEFPTALGSAYTTGYSNTTEYVGYWDANKCYSYNVPVTFNANFYNTGVNDSNALVSFGTADYHWSVIGTGSGVMNIVNDVYPGKNSTSRSLGQSSGNGATANVDFTYKTTINIPNGVDPSDVQLQFKLAFDDQIKDILVNDVSTGISYPNIDTSASVTTTLNSKNSSFVQGANTIKIVVHNFTGDAGLRVDGATAISGSNYFFPVSLAATNHVCNTGTTPYWSGNFLNWALTQTIDPFRYALSGGYRAVDKVGLTILEKAYASGQGGTVVDPAILGNASLIAKSTPFQNLTNITLRINGLGNKFYFTGSGNNYATTGIFVPDGGVPASPDATKVYEMSARVKVCDSTLLETNCTKYPNGGYKPTGLIQKNAMKLNFAAFGYLKDDDIKRDGGVLRARMAPLGPYKAVPGSTEIVNPNSEWSETTGIFNVNPDTTDATNSGVSQSGVINYLNKFGLTAGAYKTYDPVGELYYAATRYFKNIKDGNGNNIGNVAAYTSGLDDTKKDGFPVITTWDDPIKYACQANFIIGIGDTNTHADVNLPGSTIRSGNEPALPIEVQNDTSVDARVATNKVGELENIPGYTKLGEKYTPWCCNNNGFMMAGLAYDNHTKDIRPNDFKNASNVKSGIQTIATYWLDVLESGDRKDYGVTGMRNQFWLAAKYGGFTVPSGYDTYNATTAPTTTQWDTNGDGDPDNYFRANNPALMISGLTKAFDDILIKTGTGTSDGFAVVKPNIVSGDIALGTSYDSDGWTGDVVGSTVTFDPSDNPVITKVWNAVDKLEAQDWNTGRSIATAKCALVNSDGTKVCSGVQFRTATDLLAANQTDLTVLGAPAQVVLNFLRGDRSNEVSSYNFRIRKKILGDISNSKVALVGPPSSPMNDALNPGYATFKTNYASRPTMAYVGANDGMMHAFKAVTDSSGGTELFAYVPSMLFNGPNATPAADGLVALTKNPYTHHQYVDSTPVVQDVYFTDDKNWHSLLVGGLGKGGKGYYAVDVTNPANLTNESALASAVKWEFTHQNMGYSYSTPVIVKVKDTTVGENGWVVIVTSGYNNNDKNGYFFVLNPRTGTLIKKIATYATAPSTDAGLSSPNAWINDAQNYSADAIYAGDLLGVVWRLNLKDFSVTQFAALTDKNGVAQPITTKPRISVDKTTSRRFVLVGTGRLLDDSDAGNSQTQTVYALVDGTGAEDDYFKSTSLPSGVTFPIKRANLNDNTTLYQTTGITSANANTVGWFMDLADNYIVNVDMQVNAGILYFDANSLVGSSCGTTNNNRLYQINFSGGATATNGPYEESTGIVKDLTLYRNATTNPNSKVKILREIQKPDGTKSNETGKDKNASSGLNFKQINWRDLPTAD